MKISALSLLMILVFSLSALASPRHPRHLRRAHHLRSVSEPEPASPNATPELTDRAAQTSVYYADALRLSYSQTLTVRKATLRLLQEQEQDTTQLSQQMRFESTLLRVLTPGQYSAFRLLVNHQPGDDNPPVATR